uniref:Uncharacterized protein n=1 Tax=Micrurus spixii TaxID=129469 RepID=A0A2D4LTQ9_9SAUR
MKQSCLRLFHRHISLQWLKLLRDCLDAPCWASPHLLHLILLSMEPPLPAEAQEKLLYLTSIYTQEDGAFPTSGSTVDVCKPPIHTVESLLKVNAAAAAAAQPALSLPPWRLRLAFRTSQTSSTRCFPSPGFTPTRASPVAGPKTSSVPFFFKSKFKQAYLCFGFKNQIPESEV